MTIRLVQNEWKALESIKPDKIVSVKVLDRRPSADGTVLIDINGLSTRATIEADVPDSFFAFVERENNSLKLRLVSLNRSNSAIEEKQKQSLLETLKDLITGNGLPLNQNTLEAAVMMREHGLRMDAGLLRLLSYSLAKYGGELAQRLAAFIRSGLVVDGDFPDFFFHIRKFLRKALEKNKAQADNPAEMAGMLRDEAGNDRADLAVTLLQRHLEGCTFCKPFLTGKEGEEALVLARDGGNGKTKRFYFEMDDPGRGRCLVVTDVSEDGFDIRLFLDEELHERFLKGPENKDALSMKVAEAARPRKAVLTVRLLEDPDQFWENGNPENPQGLPYGSLDIYV